jgi:probable addiction module antidote protein
MSKSTSSYKDWLSDKLSNPRRAARFLNAAQEDSPRMFLKALRKVAASQSRPMTELAEAVGVSRESLYRMMSETGNPTYENLTGILRAMHFKIQVIPETDRK